MTTLAQLERAKKSLRRARREWLDEQPRGTLTRIAEEFGLSQPFVSDVLHNKRSSKDGCVEARLAQLGAPGFEHKVAN
jgi:predicted transcriptional regulator